MTAIPHHRYLSISQLGELVDQLLGLQNDIAAKQILKIPTPDDTRSSGSTTIAPIVTYLETTRAMASFRRTDRAPSEPNTFSACMDALHTLLRHKARMAHNSLLAEKGALRQQLNDIRLSPRDVSFVNPEQVQAQAAALSRMLQSNPGGGAPSAHVVSVCHTFNERLNRFIEHSAEDAVTAHEAWELLLAHQRFDSAFNGFLKKKSNEPPDQTHQSEAIDGLKSLDRALTDKVTEPLLATLNGVQRATVSLTDPQSQTHVEVTIDNNFRRKDDMQTHVDVIPSLLALHASLGLADSQKVPSAMGKVLNVNKVTTGITGNWQAIVDHIASALCEQGYSARQANAMIRDNGLTLSQSDMRTLSSAIGMPQLQEIAFFASLREQLPSREPFDKDRLIKAVARAGNLSVTDDQLQRLHLPHTPTHMHMLLDTTYRFLGHTLGYNEPALQPLRQTVQTYQAAPNPGTHGRLLSQVQQSTLNDSLGPLRNALASQTSETDSTRWEGRLLDLLRQAIEHPVAVQLSASQQRQR